jgi:ABC-type glutathione transport system ATPase component
MEIERAQPPLLEIRGLSKTFAPRRALWRQPALAPGLRSVDLTMERGRHLAVVGQSGSGKSTLALCLPRLIEPDAGSIHFLGDDVRALRGKALASVRRQIQIVFQDSATSLNPRFSAVELVEEPLLIRGDARAPRRERALAMLEQVGIAASSVDRKAWEFSGGQRQRLAIARALVLEPELLLLDEAFSGLDLSIQAQIVNLLLQLQTATRCTFLYISHDLGLMSHLADEIVVMHRGEIVERGSTGALLQRPQHPHTKELVACTAALASAFRAQAAGTT